MLQIIVILITCRIVGVLFKKIGQPMVIGEILAGIILGPSVLGHFAPEFSQFLFPKESLSNINLFSQFGLMLFMYTIGMKLATAAAAAGTAASLNREELGPPVGGSELQPSIAHRRTNMTHFLRKLKKNKQF